MFAVLLRHLYGGAVGVSVSSQGWSRFVFAASFLPPAPSVAENASEQFVGSSRLLVTDSLCSKTTTSPACARP
jgi:hypothetical protein